MARPPIKSRKPKAVQVAPDMYLERGPTNIKPPTAQELARMKKLEQQRKRNVI